ncbi:hypothetical protein [Bacteroides acidifaciens]|uniref:hypothetical protein n=1 Tax=Bacteroides acidifaciens TaxID=85831 RepID=UPI003F68C556
MSLRTSPVRLTPNAFRLIKAIQISHPVAFDFIYVREEAGMREKESPSHYLKETATLYPSRLRLITC